MKILRKINIVPFIIIVLCACVWHFMRTSPFFERIPPEITLPNMSQWNLKWDIPIHISDSSGIKSYSVIFVDKDGSEKILLEKNLQDFPREVSFNLPTPKQNITHGDILSYKILASDNSKNRFFLGNKSEKSLNLSIDTQLPKVSIIQMSNVIIKGGAAAVVFYAHDEAMSNISVTNGFQSFIAFPFHKENYFVSIIPWYIHNPTFKGAIIAQDKAGNVRRFNINFTRYNRNYRTSNITLKNAFIEGKIAEIIANENLRSFESFDSPLLAFKYVNENIRTKDSMRVNNKILNTSAVIDDFSVFKPMDNATVVGLFGDYRKFSFNRADAGESYHLGIDLASMRHAPIYASNDGIVVMSDELGIYGNALVIEHAFGVASLYAHLSESLKSEGDFVQRGEIIAKSGASGLAFGDHLHFTILLQGLPSISNEWMDSRWLKTNINDVLNSAKKIIDENDANH